MKEIEFEKLEGFFFSKIEKKFYFLNITDDFDFWFFLDFLIKFLIKKSNDKGDKTFTLLIFKIGRNRKFIIFLKYFENSHW